MTFKEFTLLNPYEQTQAVFDGSFVYERLEGRYGILLFDMVNFYVELYFDNKLNKIESLSAFKNIELVKPYLDYIDISEVIKLL